MRTRLGGAILLLGVMAALVLPGCGYTRSGTFGHVFAVDTNISYQLVAQYYSQGCSGDFNGNGAGGGPQDRAYCVLRTARGFEGQIPNSCAIGRAGGGCWTARQIFREAVANREWEDFGNAIQAVFGRAWINHQHTCLALDVGSSVDQVAKRPLVDGPTAEFYYKYNWTTRGVQPGVCV